MGIRVGEGGRQAAVGPLNIITGRRWWQGGGKGLLESHREE